MASEVTVRIHYHQEPRGWWAESPEIDGWSLAGETYEEVRRLAEDGVPFALASEAEERGEGFDEQHFVGADLEHHLAAPA
jgi:predicted RNase H-like HicB family nuclease